MTRRLLVSYLTITVVVLLLLGVPLGAFYSQRERERIAADLEHDANVIATVYEDDLESDRPLFSGAAEAYEDRTGARVVVVDDAGISHVDTADAIERDFSTRPEVAAALEGTRTTGTRASETLGVDLFYVAVPVASGGTVHGAVRLTLDTGEVDARIRQFWWALAAVAVVVLAAVGVIGWVIARSVTRPLRALTDDVRRFAVGDLAASEHAIDGPPEIRELDETMAAMARRLDGLLATQRAFVADASHQLRTPLTALRLRLENLQSRLDSISSDERIEDAAIEVDAAIDETGRLTELVTNLLQLARADERQETAVVDLGGLVADRVDTWSAVADAAGVALRQPSSASAGGASSTVRVRAVPGAIEQILDNLLDNALGVSAAGADVLVDIRTEGERVILEVADSGPGLNDADKVDALRRFWRGDTSKPGTGLGLAIVQALAVASGGSVALRDSDMGGLVVEVTLPVAS